MCYGLIVVALDGCFFGMEIHCRGCAYNVCLCYRQLVGSGVEQAHHGKDPLLGDPFFQLLE